MIRLVACAALAAALIACRADTHDERVLWRFVAFQQRFWHGYCDSTEPVLHDDRVYVGNGYPWDDASDRDATHLFALDRRTGRELWRARTGGVFDGTRPALDGDLVAIRGGTRLQVFSTIDGRRVWSRNGVTSRWTTADRTIYLELPSAIVALELATGRHKWRLEIPSRLLSPPVVAGTHLYFAAGERKPLLYVVHRERGVYDGSARELPGFNGMLAAADGRIFAGAGFSGRRATYEWVDGAEPASRRDRGFLAIQDRVAYFAAADTLYAVGTVDGRDLWSRPRLPTVRFGGLLIDDGIFYQPDLRGRDRLLAFDLVNGRELWAFESADRLAPAALGADAIFLSGDDCTVTALRRGR